jgi:cytochrome c556
MKRIVFLLLIGSLAIIRLTAQAPPGWMVRADNSTSASDPDAPGDIRFVARGAGFRATDPRAAVFWNPANTIAGDYALKGTFTLLEPSNHTNYYGLVFGGSQLDGPAQQYVYFLVAQDGTWLVKRRDGDATTQTVLPKTPSSAVNKPDASGQSVNVLEVRVTGASIEFIVNGTVVNRWSGAARAVKTHGTYGIRVNHFLDVQIDGLAASAASKSQARSTSKRPDAETVALTATAGGMLSPVAFVLEREGGSDPETVVVVPALPEPIAPNRLVTVFGTSAPFDSGHEGGALARLSPDLVAKYRGRSSVLATAVLSETMVDLTKPLPPPATTDEDALDESMKRIALAFASLRQEIDAQNADMVRQHAATLAQAFTTVEGFWATRSKLDATTWARNARLQAEAIVRDATSNKLGSVAGAMGTLGQQCQSCHAMYRMQFANGAFRIKNSR